MNASTREEVEAFRLLALRSALKLEAVGMKSSKGRSAFSIVKRMTGINARSAKELLPIYEGVLRDMGVLSRAKSNPRRPSETEMSGTRPQVGRYTSFRKWVEAVRNLGKEPQSDSPVPQVVYGPFNIVSEWNGKSGTINEYFDYNPAVRGGGKWKIQTASANGWADLKASIDGGPYVPDLYDSKAEAQREMDDIVESTGSGDEYGSYRVVPASTRANDDLYNPLVRRKGESERDFMARCMSQEKKSFPKQKQRVAVCLSKSRRNPYDRNLDS